MMTGRQIKGERGGKSTATSGTSRADSSEVYSPPRVNGLAKQLGVIPGMSLDLTVEDPDDGKPWDFNNPEKRDKAERMIRDKRGLLLIGSPMCSAFSQLQSLNRTRIGEEKYQDMVKKGTEHLEFCAKLYKMQMENGLYFIHEHPAGAKSWDNELIRRLTEKTGVYTVIGDMCRYGMKQEDELGTGLVKKRTMFMTNAEMIAGRLAKRCNGGHRHIELINGRAKMADISGGSL